MGWLRYFVTKLCYGIALTSHSVRWQQKQVKSCSEFEICIFCYFAHMQIDSHAFSKTIFGIVFDVSFCVAFFSQTTSFYVDFAMCFDHRRWCLPVIIRYCLFLFILADALPSLPLLSTYLPPSSSFTFVMLTWLMTSSWIVTYCPTRNLELSGIWNDIHLSHKKKINQIKLKSMF